jgi:hypothetical protein
MASDFDKDAAALYRHFSTSHGRINTSSAGESIDYATAALANALFVERVKQVLADLPALTQAVIKEIESTNT